MDEAAQEVRYIDRVMKIVYMVCQYSQWIPGLRSTATEMPSSPCKADQLG